ncbi:phospholipid phosphatase-related protein type 4-like [Cebidichthys violaceus]|uniref:phospholipid phosphatase-related protein type 4-like n=1 Tax=Cebidichthys violaceus TaxID=271503 RepID=UPI0035C953D7
MSRAKERLKGGNETKDSVTLLPCFYFVELPILASSVVSLYFLELTDIFQPVHSGYSCNDRSLSLPYILPRQEVCTLPLLFSLAFAVPTATILIGEAILYCYLSRRSSATQTEANINAAGCNFNSYIRRAVRFIGVHIFGLCVTALITDILQLSTGQHTPYWLDVCKPNLTHINMSTCDEAFILEDICSGQDAGLINAGRKSFPSQHATLAAFAAVYISMYFNAVLTDSAKLLKPLLVFSFVMLAILAGLTRIIQFRNHPVDVYCGWLLGSAIAVYLGVYAVGNFQPSEDRSRSRAPTPTLREPPLSSLPNVSQSAISNSHQGHHTLAPSQPEPIITRTSSHTLSPNQAEPMLTRSASYREPSLSNLKRASAEVEVITPSSPLGNHDNMMTFSSSTLPRSHGGSSLEEGRIPRRHASIHTSMDSTRSKQLLSQWKNKNDNRKLSLQVMDGIRPASSSSPQRNMELRCSSEPSAMGLEEHRGGIHLPSLIAFQETELRAGAHIPAQYMKLAASSVPMANHNHLSHNGSTGLTGGARVSIQSRPGSSQLVHIPEEENLTSKDQESESEDSIMDGGGSVREKWLRVAEKTTIPCRPLSAGGQPRLMQVIALSKQQGLLHSPRSEDGGSTVSCTGSIRYRALTDQDPSPPASTTGAMGGGGGLERSGSIVRVEAHPESRSNKPVVKPPSTDGSGSWRWKPPDQRASLRQSAFALNDLNRHTDSCDSLRDGESVDGRRSVTGTESESEGGGEGGGGGIGMGGGGGVYTNHPHVVHPLHPLHPNNPNNYQNPNFNPNNPNFNNAHFNFNPNSVNFNPDSANSANFNPNSANFNPNSANFNPNSANFNPNSTNFNPNSANFNPNSANFNPNSANFNPNSTNFNPNSTNFNPNSTNFNPNTTNSNMPFTPTATFAPPFHPHPQAITTIRVTPVEVTAASSDGGSDCQSVASSSRESTLRRKSGSQYGHAPDRGPTPDLHNNHRLCDDSNRLDNESSNRFHENLRSFQENPIHPNHPNHPNRQLQGMFGRPSPTPPPTLPRPILSHTPPPTLGLAYKE